jgi:alpha-ribazole phosphatase
MSEITRQIYLIRHTTPRVELGTCYGQTDLDVNEDFLHEFGQIQSLVPNATAMPLFTSPLQRCRKLALALGGLSITEDSRLMELNFGEWEMKKWVEMSSPILQVWRQDYIHTSTPQGESFYELHLRSLDCWKEIIATDHKELGIITHYGVIQSILAHLLHIPLDKGFRLELGYGAVVRITIRENEQLKIKFLR